MAFWKLEMNLATAVEFQSEIERLQAEIELLREAIRRLAEQDATLSLLCKRDGSQVVTVTMDATFTDAEREAIEWAAVQSNKERDIAASAASRGYQPDGGGDPAEWAKAHGERADTLRGLLERTRCS